MHRHFKLISDEMLDRGIEFSQVVPRNIDIPITPEYLKMVFQAIGLKMYHTLHTSELTKYQLSQVEKVFSRWVALTGIDIPFPSNE